MNDKRNIYSLLLLLPALLFFSCSQEDMPGAAGKADGSGIVFRAAVSDAGTRSANTTETTDLDEGFHVTAFCPEDEVSDTLNPYFAEQPATRIEETAGRFGIYPDDQSSEPLVWPTTRHGKLGALKFFAFYPSREVLRQSSGVASGSGYFELKNNSKKNGTTVSYDYRMLKFKVNRDIARHIDFVTVAAEGSKRANGKEGVALAFEHQLSRIVLKAWGNTVNDIEIAGVKIGCPVTESDFNFAEKPEHYAVGDNTTCGNWVGTKVRGCVEYIFREGDAVVKIGNGSCTSEAQAVSIMGKGGWAMVIPADNSGWNCSEDAANSKQGIYFSVLLRVKENDINRTLVYPYIEGTDLSNTELTDVMDVIYFSIQKATGKVMKRLYRNKADRKFYTGQDFTEVYTVPDDEEVRNYGWAAIPLATYRWKPGYQYTYTLNYSNGVGVEAPDARYPGKPIISKIMVGVTETEGNTSHKVGGFEVGSSANVTGDIEMG